MKNSQPNLSARQRQRLATVIRAEIRRLDRCVVQLSRVDREVFELAIGVFENPSGFALWLCSPICSLNGRTPLVCLRTRAGREQVIHVLHAIAHGFPL